MMIQDAEGLKELVEELRAAGSFALDTEFIRERTYRPRLCLVQVATSDRAVIVDPQGIERLDPFLELVADPGVEKVVHAGEQDMEIFQGLSGRVPARIVDTQVAAALVGRGERPSYGRLVEDVCGVRLGKGETFTDWSRRPLTREQVEYALNDVRYLLPVIRTLRAELEQLGRLGWFEEELVFYEDPASYVRNHETRYRKVRGATRLDRRELAVLRELTLWREQEAEKRDWPRARVLQDDLLVEVARRKPRKVESIQAIRGVHSRLVQRSGRAIVKRVQKALELPESAWPQLRTRSADEGELAAVVDLLQVILQVRAAESKIAPAYLGVRRDLLELARRELQPRVGDDVLEPVALLQGWRRSLVGEKLLGLLRGRAQVRVDPEAGRVRVEDVTGVD